MIDLTKRIRDSKWFQNAITFIIIIAGIVVGIESYKNLDELFYNYLFYLDKIILTVFIIEILIKILAEGKRPWRYFYDSWNVFDFLIVFLVFVPFGGSSVAVLRLLRLFRILRLVKALPRLQVLVQALLNSIPSMGYVSLLLFLLFYVYGVAAVSFFGENDPIHFANLHLSMVSLFRIVTLEDWTDIMYINMYGCANYGYTGNEIICTQSSEFPLFSPIFFISFVLLGTMIILNLFIGVIMNGMSEASSEINMEKSLDEKNRIIKELSLKINDLKSTFDKLT